MRPNRSVLACVALVVAGAAALAQQAPPAAPPIVAVDPEQFDPAAVERGQQLHVAQCGFCHGSNARGGSSGPDLTRSELVQSDENGRQLGEFLRTGRPDNGMPAFQLSEDQTLDLATFLHAAIYLNANRRLYQILDVLTGDAAAGEAFFNGAGRCATCHSVAGDLKGIGSRYDPVTLQQRILMPRGGRGQGPPQPGYLDRNAIRAAVTLPSLQRVEGVLVRVTDFDVTIYDPAAGEMRTWLRHDNVPEVTLTDPLQAHVDMWTRWTDADMHNMTAYLAEQK
jgi:mono/diheme cytochrome c family protein